MWSSATLMLPTLERRKNMIYRKSKVRISLQPTFPCCPATLLRWWRDIRFGAQHLRRHVFPKFDGRPWSQGESRVQLATEDPLPYDRLRFWMTGLLAPLNYMYEADFLKKFGMKSFRSGGATAAGTANIPFEVWGSHGGWQSRESQMRYLEISLEQALQVTATVTAIPDTTNTLPDESSEEDMAPDDL